VRSPLLLFFVLFPAAILGGQQTHDGDIVGKWYRGIPEQKYNIALIFSADHTFRATWSEHKNAADVYNRSRGRWRLQDGWVVITHSTGIGLGYPTLLFKRRAGKSYLLPAPTAFELPKRTYLNSVYAFEREK
jgi:hypothetical protein